MAQNQPRHIYGIHEMAPYVPATGAPYGNFRVLGGASINLSGELIQLTGGSSPYPWSSQDGNITAELVFSPKEIPDFLFKLMLGNLPTTINNDPGNVSSLTNVEGTSVQDATTGIASVGVKSGSEADVKFGKYLVVAVSATTVDVYGLSSADFQRGTDKEYVDDTLKLTSTPLSITASAAVEVPGFGVELTGGSGVIAMTTDDTAEFEANPPSLEQTDVEIGAIGSCIPEFGAVITSQKQSDGGLWIFDVYRIKAIGYPFGMAEKAFNEPEMTANILYDSAKNGIMKARYIKPIVACS